MRDLSELGIRPRRRNPYPAASVAQIAEFGRHFGISVPKSYAAFLMFANGGLPTLSVYDDPNGGIGGVNDFYGLGQKSCDDQAAAIGKWDIGNLWGETRVLRPLIGEMAIPFARDGGDNQLF